MEEISRMLQEIDNHIFVGDSREVLKAFPDAIVNTTVTSPPYYNLRDYGEENQIGLEESLDDYIEQLCIVFDEVHRVTKDDGTFWLNIGDCYANKGEIPSDGRKGFSRTSGMGIADKTIEGLTTKDLIGVPWRVAFALQKRGWILRSDIIWAKKNPIPESVKDRPTSSHEHIFLFSKQPKYYFDSESIKEKIENLDNNGGYEHRNKRDVWSVRVASYPGSHCATFPMELITPCIKAGSPEGGLVLDPFMGTGTVAEAAKKLSRKYTGCELNLEYWKIIQNRLKQQELF
jgi:site-specific DNA-methyltransferase (cytosine-N4-specific)|tara:strand:+ start:1811 stop:2674 length:864 start_codon:yes stop_codon:yes gene_type:complete